jgi:hypothetical protein
MKAISTLLAIVVGTLAVSASAKPTGGNGREAVAVRDGLIAFMRPGKVGEYDIWVVRPNGKGLRRLTTTPRDHSDYNPTSSPDGSTVLFERRGDADGEDLYTVPATEGAPRRLTDCAGNCWSDGEARWSRDGSQIAFGRATGPRAAQFPSLAAIYVMDTDGRNVRQLSHPPKGFEDHYPTWAPDGKTIVFQRDTTTATPGPTKLVSVDSRSRASGPSMRCRAGRREPESEFLAGREEDPLRLLVHLRRQLSEYQPHSGTPPPGDNQRRRPGAARAPAGDPSRQRRLGTSGTRIVYRCNANNLSGLFNLCVSRLDGSGFKRFPWQLLSAHPSWGTHP